MKVVFMGGPDDGKEMDVPSDTREWSKPVITKARTLRELTSPFIDDKLPYKVEKWPLRKLVTPSGRTIIAIVHPTLNVWLDKNFGEKGKKDGER